MNIQPVNFYTINCNSNKSINSGNSAPNFKSASDLTLRYMLKKHSALLPESVLKATKELVYNPVLNMPTLEELHHKVYAGLMSAKTLEEVKALYPELAEVKNSLILKNNRSVAVKVIEKNMPLEDFTLAYLKDLYSLKTENEIVAKYGFSNRSLLSWLNHKLNIVKPKTNYHTLVAMSNDGKNKRIGDLTRQALLRDPETQQKRLAKAAETHRTQEYREKKRQEMIEFYRRQPAAAYRVSQISQMTWDKCPQIKAALAEYTYEQEGILKKALKDRSDNKPLMQQQKRMIAGYYKRFWEKYPEFKKQYRQARLDAIEELKKEGLIL